MVRIDPRWLEPVSATIDVERYYQALAAIPGIDQSWPVHHRDPVPCRKSAARRDEPRVTFGDGDRDARGNHRPLPRTELHSLT